MAVNKKALPDNTTILIYKLDSMLLNGRLYQPEE